MDQDALEFQIVARRYIEDLNTIAAAPEEADARAAQLMERLGRLIELSFGSEHEIATVYHKWFTDTFAYWLRTDYTRLPPLQRLAGSFSDRYGRYLED